VDHPVLIARSSSTSREVIHFGSNWGGAARMEVVVSDYEPGKLTRP
jgi:hypothetical protein